MNSDFALSEFLRLIRQQADERPFQMEFRDVGTLIQVGSGVAGLSGLAEAMADELVAFPTQVRGLILNLERRRIDCVLLGSDEGLQGGDLVVSTGERLRVPVGHGLLGRAIDPLGNTLDGQGPVEAEAWHYLDREAAGVIERQPVGRPLETGLKAIDALVPIGRGQRELIIGDRQTGKTAIAIDTIINQKDKDVVCVYVSIGQKKSSTQAVRESLEQYGAISHTVLVVADPDSPPALRYLAPYAGCSIAEYFTDRGDDALIVYDDLSKHADAYRELSLLLRRPPGREAYPGDVFYLHARLLERAGQFDQSRHNGSLTALPIVETKRGQISAYIPTNLISITDGQVYLDTGRFNRGFRPAIDLGLSVSRVGSAAQSSAMRSVAGRLRLELTQYEEVARFTRFGTEIDEATRRQISRGEHLAEALKQDRFSPMPVSHQVTALQAAAKGYLDQLSVSQVQAFESTLLNYVAQQRPHVLQTVTDAEEWSSAMEHDLDEVLSDAVESLSGESAQSD
jgi:F-type H+-transporting ATPase subunit alpha